MLELSEFEWGFLIGLLIGEGHFGGDGRQPQVTLRMHVRHQRIFDWLQAKVPFGKLYGPYSHGGRNYYQWMVRGQPLREVLLPHLDRRLRPELDEHAFQRFVEMKRRYKMQPGAEPSA